MALSDRDALIEKALHYAVLLARRKRDREEIVEALRTRYGAQLSPLTRQYLAREALRETR